MTNPTFVESGFTITPTVATDGGGAYFKVPFKNLTSVASKVIVGFKYTYDITLPTIYFSSEPLPISPIIQKGIIYIIKYINT